jgi:hypothetical protein
VLLILLTIACSSEPHRKQDKAVQTSTTAKDDAPTERIAKRPPPPAVPMLNCSPQFVGPGDVVHVQFQDPLGEAAVIIDPSGWANVLTQPHWDFETIPPLDSAFLQRSNKLEIPVSQVSRAWIDNPAGYIFRETGFYRVIIGVGDDFIEAHPKRYCDLYYDAEQRVTGKNLRMSKPQGWNWVLDDPTDE